MQAESVAIYWPPTNILGNRVTSIYYKLQSDQATDCGKTAARSYDIPITYKRKIFTSDCTAWPGTFSVDFVVPTSTPPPLVDVTLPPRTTFWDAEAFDALGADDKKCMLIVLPGLAGGSSEMYLRSVLMPLCLAPPADERWEACVINARGCALSKITSGVLYNARATWDVRQFVKWTRKRWPCRKLFACGFSLGANILVNVRKLVLSWQHRA